MSEPIHIVHPSLWENLAQLDADAVCRQSGAQLDETSGSYIIDFLQERYRIAPETRGFSLLSGPAPAEAPSRDLQVVVITYLLSAREMPLSHELVAASSLKGGKTFFQGAHRFPLDALIEQYGGDPDGFLARGLSLGAAQEHFGDTGLRFPALPRVPVVMVLWRDDEEFPARLSVLFDASIESHLPLDAIYGLVTEICRRMEGRG